MVMVAQTRSWLVAILLLCICLLLFVSAVVANEESSLVCTVDDAREECAATSLEEENTVDDNNPTCVDTHESCRTWAIDGECQKNPNCEWTFFLRSHTCFCRPKLPKLTIPKTCCQAADGVVKFVAYWTRMISVNHNRYRMMR